MSKASELISGKATIQSFETSAPVLFLLSHNGLCLFYFPAEVFSFTVSLNFAVSFTAVNFPGQNYLLQIINLLISLAIQNEKRQKKKKGMIFDMKSLLLRYNLTHLCLTLLLGYFRCVRLSWEKSVICYSSTSEERRGKVDAEL